MSKYKTFAEALKKESLNNLTESSYHDKVANLTLENYYGIPEEKRDDELQLMRSSLINVLASIFIMERQECKTTKEVIGLIELYKQLFSANVDLLQKGAVKNRDERLAKEKGLS